MAIENSTKLPTWFWIVAGLALVWNLLGVGAYLADVTMSETALSELPAEQRELRNATPTYITAAYAVAVFAGLLGSIALLMRKAWATPLFGASLLAVVIQMGFVFIALNAAAVMGASAMLFPAFIIIIGGALLWFSMNVKKRGWIN